MNLSICLTSTVKALQITYKHNLTPFQCQVPILLLFPVNFVNPHVYPQIIINTVNMRLANAVKIIQQTPKYQQLLLYTYPPFMLSSISESKCKQSSISYILNSIKILKNRLREGRTNHENIQKNVRASTIMMHEAYSRNPATAFQYMKHYILTDPPIDYKYSEFYNEGVITKMVAIFRDHSSFEIEWATQFVQLMLIENIILQDRIDRISEIVGIKRKEAKTKHQYFRQGKLKQDINNNIPFRTFAFMNRQFDSKQINQPAKMVSKSLFNQTYEQRLDADAAQNAEELATILNREKINIEGCKLTRIDFLVGFDFLLTFSKNTQKIQNFATGYIYEDISKPHKQINSTQRAIQVILLARISQSLYKLYPQFSKYITYYVNYAQEFVTILQNMKEVEFTQLIGRSDRLFQKYLLVELPPYVNSKPIKEQYLRILTVMLNHRKYGDLLYPHQSIYGLFQSLLILCCEEDREAVTQILTSYEYYQLFHPSLCPPARDACLLAIRYDFQSSILSHQLASTLKYSNWLINQTFTSYHNTSIKTDINMAFEHHVCLQLKEQTQDNQSLEIERRMIDIFETIDPNQICREKKQKVDQFVHHIRKLALQQIAYFQKWLRIAEKISQIARRRKDEQISQRLSKKMNELMRDKISREYILDFIAYPNLYELLNSILKYEKSQECQSYLKQIEMNLSKYLELSSDEQMKRQYPYSNPILYKPLVGCISIHTPKDLSYRKYYGLPYFDIATARISSQKLQKEEAIMNETISSVLISEPIIAEVEEKVEQTKIIKATPLSMPTERRKIGKLKSETKSELETKMKESLQASINENQKEEASHKNNIKKNDSDKLKIEKSPAQVSFFKKPIEDYKLEKNDQTNPPSQKNNKVNTQKSVKENASKIKITNRFYSKNRLKRSKKLQPSTNSQKQLISQTEKKNFFQKKPEVVETPTANSPSASPLPQPKPKRPSQARKWPLRLPAKASPSVSLFFKKNS